VSEPDDDDDSVLDEARRLEVLDRAACIELLAHHRFVGRLGFITEGRPMVLPVNYIVEGDSVVFCTAGGTKLNAIKGGADVAFEVSGAQGGVQTAVDALAVRGRLCLVAIHPRPREVNLHRFFWRELTLVGTRLYSRPDWDRAVALIAAGHVPARGLISAVVPLGSAPDAFAAIERGGEGMKVLVDCQATGNTA